MTTPADAFAALQEAERSGELARLADRLSLGLIVVFGSVARGDPSADDLDVAVSSRPGTRLDILDVVNALLELTRFDDVDVMDLDRADALARQHALVPGEPLYEYESGGFVREQLRASAERLSTEWMRQADLVLLAGGDPP